MEDLSGHAGAQTCRIGLGWARAWVPVIVYCAAIFAASSIPGSSDMPRSDLPVDKLLHFCVYTGLGGLLFRALALGPSQRGALNAVLLATCCGLLYGISDELHQILTPGRNPDVADVVADVLGSATGAALARVFYARTRE